MKPKIYIIGVNHGSIDDGLRILRHARNLRPEAIFFERSSRNLTHLTTKEWIMMALKNPAFFLGMYVYSMLLRIWARVIKLRTGQFNLADTIYSERASRELGIPLHNIDDNIFEMSMGGHIGWTPASWAGLFLVPIAVMAFWANPVLTILFTIIYLMLFLLAFALLTVPRRNQHMEVRMDHLTKKNTLKRALLVTGKEHVADFCGRLSNKYDVEVLER